HRASLPNDVSLPDLPKMRAVLETAQEDGQIVSAAPVGLWVTEFSWDSNPPDPLGVPEASLLRWVPDGLYEMWRDGVSLVAWFTLDDQPPSTLYQAGLRYADASAKPHAQAFRFPVVGVSHRNQLEVWGRTPGGRQADVTVQHLTSGGW